LFYTAEKDTIVKNQWHIDNPVDCPVVYAVSLIGGKWKPIILQILTNGPVRFGELRRKIPPVTQKMLTQQLRELEADGMLTRTVYAEVPPRVEYRLSDSGLTVIPVLTALRNWGLARNPSKTD
jgi:DNA-binding HxlR family transcriptional regulator